jgi:hypothetical protein
MHTERVKLVKDRTGLDTLLNIGAFKLKVFMWVG